MIAKIKMIAESISTWRSAEAKPDSDELLECGIRQFGDGMGITSIMGCPDDGAAEHSDEKVCTA